MATTHHTQRHRGENCAWCAAQGKAESEGLALSVVVDAMMRDFSAGRWSLTSAARKAAVIERPAAPEWARPVRRKPRRVPKVPDTVFRPPPMAWQEPEEG